MDGTVGVDDVAILYREQAGMASRHLVYDTRPDCRASRVINEYSLVVGALLRKNDTIVG